MSTEYTYLDQNDKVRTMRLRSHWVLVRRTKANREKFLVGVPDQVTSVPFTNADAMELAESATESLAKFLDEPACEVLAMGPDVGKPRSKAELKKRRLFTVDGSGRTHWKDLAFDGKVGDFVWLPEVAESGRMIRGATGREYDIIVDEGELQGAYVPKDAA